METLNFSTTTSDVAIQDYLTLQKRLDAVIGKIGLSKTIQLIEGFIDNSSIKVNEVEKFKLITAYIISQTIDIFDLKEDQFYTSKIREYRDGRMACFHLLKHYTDCSYAKIGEAFNQKKRNILYFCQKCDEMLSIPQFYRVFTDRYMSLENRVISFIAKLS